MEIDLTGVDETKPNAGRIYDYLLGGDFNLPIDRAAAKRLDKMNSKISYSMWLNRFFLFHAVKQLSDAGLDFYIDLATGLPTQGYLHDRLPATTRIVYNDIDPTTVLHGRRIVENYPNVHYVQSDVRDVDVILDAADNFFEAKHRRVGFCMVGVAYFIEDEALSRIFRRLYEWSSPGSLLALSMFRPDEDPEAQGVIETYRSMGISVHMRNEAETLDLLKPWVPYQEFQSLESYAESEFTQPVVGDQLRGRVGFGGILHHP